MTHYIQSESAVGSPGSYTDYSRKIPTARLHYGWRMTIAVLFEVLRVQSKP